MAAAAAIGKRRTTRPPAGTAGQAGIYPAANLADKEEEQGYYYGFANRALWPLCHIAYTRPIFDASDWEQYSRVNAKFAEAVLDEIRDSPAIVLVQDYHFALLPRILKTRRPDAIVSHFWHIPWPHREAFRICPVAGGDSRRSAGKRSARLSRAAALQQFSRDGRPVDRVARRLRAVFGDARGARDKGPAVSDQHRHGGHLAERARAERRAGIQKEPRLAR